MAARTVVKSEAEWRAELTPKEFNGLRKAGTEAPGTGEYNEFFPNEGYFACRACKYVMPYVYDAEGDVTLSLTLTLTRQVPALRAGLKVQGLRLGRVRQVLLHG